MYIREIFGCEIDSLQNNEQNYVLKSHCYLRHFDLHYKRPGFVNAVRIHISKFINNKLYK